MRGVNDGLVHALFLASVRISVRKGTYPSIGDCPRSRSRHKRNALISKNQCIVQ
jgi:hypothetical protein